MKKIRIKNKKGFTLIEMIIVITILGLLAAILVPSMIHIVGNARENVLQANCAGIQSFIALAAAKYDSDHLFQNSDDSGTGNPEDQTYLGRYLETYFEQAGYGKNNFVIKNPYSGKTGVLNYSSYKLPEEYRRLAVVISDNSSLEYAASLSQAEGKTYLSGCIIIYMKNGNAQIEIYYIDKNGKKSEQVKYLSAPQEN